MTSDSAVTATRPLSGAPLVDAPFATALVELGHERPELVVVSADLSKYTDVAPFAPAFPDRFFQVGMAEQNLMGIAGGLAKTGFIPVAATYCVFATRRAGDQVQMALSTGHRTAVIAAFLPGITTPFRASHQGNDDLAIMRAIPGMTVIDPMDATELAAALRAAVAVPGPVYLRGQRGQVPEIIDPALEFVVGRQGSCATVATSALSVPAGDKLGAGGGGLLAGRGERGSAARPDAEAVRQPRRWAVRRAVPRGRDGGEPLGHRRPRLSRLRGCG